MNIVFSKHNVCCGRDVVEPTPCVPGLRVTQVAAGGMHSCVLTDAGEVRRLSRQPFLHAAMLRLSYCPKTRLHSRGSCHGRSPDNLGSAAATAMLTSNRLRGFVHRSRSSLLIGSGV